MGVPPVFIGDVTADGERLVMLPEEAPRRRAYLRRLAGQRVDMILKPHKDTRSLRANNYYWSQVLTPMSRDSSAGDATPEEIHDAMCERFLPNEHKRVEFFNRMTGESLQVDTDHRRSSKLTGGPFYDFVEQVRKFALEFMGLITEDPDPEYWRHRKTTKARTEAA